MLGSIVQTKSPISSMSLCSSSREGASVKFLWLYRALCLMNLKASCRNNLWIFKFWIRFYINYIWNLLINRKIHLLKYFMYLWIKWTCNRCFYRLSKALILFPHFHIGGWILGATVQTKSLFSGKFLCSSSRGVSISNILVIVQSSISHFSL